MSSVDLSPVRSQSTTHTAQGHVVHHGDPEPHGAGGNHVEVKVLDEDVVRLHQDVQHHHGVLQHYGIQSHHGGPHVPVQHGLRLFGHGMTSRVVVEAI